MTTKAEQIVTEMRAAAEALTRLGEHVTLSVVLEDQAALVREVATVAQGEVVGHAFRPALSAVEMEITSARWQVGRVLLTVQSATARPILPTCSVCEHVFRPTDLGSDVMDPEAPVCADCVEHRATLKRREAETRARETAELAVDVRRERAKDGRVCP